MGKLDITTEGNKKYVYVIDEDDLYEKSKCSSGPIYYIGVYKDLPVYSIPWLKEERAKDIRTIVLKSQPEDFPQDQYFVIENKDIYDGRFKRIGKYDGIYVKEE